MNLLITGSNGFVGKYFIKKYKDNYNIRTFSFLKDDINSLDCSDIDVVFQHWCIKWVEQVLKNMRE